ncbi:MAG: tautomerase family protein [Candidatus Woesearchaeota archaeon]
MPFVKIDMMPHKINREKLMNSITKAFMDVGIPKEWVQIVINENDKKNWYVRGVYGPKLK